MNKEFYFMDGVENSSPKLELFITDNSKNLSLIKFKNKYNM